MVVGEGLFDNFEDKKEEKKKMDKDTVEIKIRFNKMWLERAIFIVIILILLVLVFYNPFGKYRCEKGLSEIESEPVAKTEKNETREAEAEGDIEIEEEPVVEEEPETEPEPNKELSGEVGLTIGDILLSNDSKKVESIGVDINNDKGLFTPLLRIYWYGPTTPDAVKESVKYEYQFPSLISTGRMSKKLDDEICRKNNRKLTGRYLNLEPDDNKVTFKIEIYNANDNATLLDSKLKSISIS